MHNLPERPAPEVRRKALQIVAEAENERGPALDLTTFDLNFKEVTPTPETKAAKPAERPKRASNRNQRISSVSAIASAPVSGDTALGETAATGVVTGGAVTGGAVTGGTVSPVPGTPSLVTEQVARATKSWAPEDPRNDQAAQRESEGKLPADHLSTRAPTRARIAPGIPALGGIASAVVGLWVLPRTDAWVVPVLILVAPVMATIIARYPMIIIGLACVVSAAVQSLPALAHLRQTYGILDTMTLSMVCASAIGIGLALSTKLKASEKEKTTP